MANKKVDFYQLGNKLWNIANIFRDDTLKTTEYLEEFSYFLFLKLFDDQERQKEEFARAEGREFTPSLPEELRFHHWAEKIINNEIDVTDAVKAVQDVFQKLANIEDKPGKDLSLFRKLFKNHIWRIKYGPTIRELLKQLKDLELEQNFDVMGRAYEFVVQKLGEQKQYGQYFTPRHIIHFMVDLADPEIGEMIYDPAAGTGGFILRAYEIVKKKIDEEVKGGFSGVQEPTSSYGKVAYDRGEKLVRDLKERHLWAVEKAPDVYKLAMMNMILHNDGKSNLYEADSLDNRAQQEHREKYHIVLSNPPYGPLTQSRTATFTYHVKRFEALFFQHIMNALKYSEPGKKPSRAVVIILDKILFDNSSAFKNIRKKLLREFNLKAVFSMPAGIFQPYSGVKTTVMYFERPTKEEWKRIKNENDFATQRVLFFDVKSDGFTLSTQRRPINGAFQGENPNIYDPPCGDLPRAVEVFKRWNEWLENPTDELPDFVDNEQVWTATIDEIKDKDFNLNPGLYRKVERGKVKWEWVRLGEIIQVNFGERITKKEHEGSQFPVYGGGGISFYTNNFNAENEIVISRFGMSEECVRFVKGKFWLLDSGFTVKPLDDNKLNAMFLFYCLKYLQYKIYSCGRGPSQKNIDMNCFYNIHIPLPPIEIQRQIVERLNKQQAIIEKMKEAEQAILEAGIDDAIFEGDWDWVELGEVASINPSRREIKELDDETEVSFIPMEYVSNYLGQIEKQDIKKLRDVKNGFTYFAENDVLFAKITPCMENGKIAVASNLCNKIGFGSTEFHVIRPKNNILSKFIYYWISRKYFRKEAEKNFKGSSGHRRVPAYFLKYSTIPLPPLEKQKEIVDFLDAQFKTLEHIRKLKQNAQETIKLILEKEVFTDG